MSQQPSGVTVSQTRRASTATAARHASASGSGDSSSHTRTANMSSGTGTGSSSDNNRSSGDDDRAGSNNSNSGADDQNAGHHMSVSVGVRPGISSAQAAAMPHVEGSGPPATTDVAPVPIIAERFKTKLCKKFEQTGHCPYTNKCMFAHGSREMRTVEQNMEEGIVSQIAVYSLRRRMAKSKPDHEEAPPNPAVTTVSQPAGNHNNNHNNGNDINHVAATYGTNTVAPANAPLQQPHWQQYHNHHAFPAASPQLCAPGAGMYPPSMLMPPMLPMPQPFLPPPGTQAPHPPLMSHHHYHAHHALPHSGVWPPPFGPYGTALPPPLPMPTANANANANGGGGSGVAR